MSLGNNHDLPCETVSSTHMNGSDVVHCSPDMVQAPGIVAPISGKVVAEVTSPMNTLLLSGMVHSLSGNGLKEQTSNNSNTDVKELRAYIILREILCVLRSLLPSPCFVISSIVLSLQSLAW
jgi:hypothetical protein